MEWVRSTAIEGCVRCRNGLNGRNALFACTTSKHTTKLIYVETFLPRDATQSAVMSQYVVCLSVCLSACGVQVPSLP